MNRRFFLKGATIVGAVLASGLGLRRRIRVRFGRPTFRNRHIPDGKAFDADTGKDISRTVWMFKAQDDAIWNARPGDRLNLKLLTLDDSGHAYLDLYTREIAHEDVSALVVEVFAV